MATRECTQTERLPHFPILRQLAYQQTQAGPGNLVEIAMVGGSGDNSVVYSNRSDK